MKQSDIRKALILKGIIVARHVTKTPAQIRNARQSAINARRREMGFAPIHII